MGDYTEYLLNKTGEQSGGEREFNYWYADMIDQDENYPMGEGMPFIMDDNELRELLKEAHERGYEVGFYKGREK